MSHVQVDREPECRRVKLTAAEKRFGRWLAKGLTVEQAAIRAGFSRRKGFYLLAQLREAHAAMGNGK